MTHLKIYTPAIALSLVLMLSPLMAFAEEAVTIGECFSASKSQIPLKSNRLSNTYQAYKITVQNDCQFPIEVINAQAP